MKQYLVEIFRQKRLLVAIVSVLLLFNVTVGTVVSSYQFPAISELQTEWNELRRLAIRNGQADGALLYKLGSADLEKLKSRILEKREFARVLSELLESASASVVELGNITYKPVPIKEQSLFSYQMTLSASGTYAAVKSYLADLQNNQNLMVVDSVNFSNSDQYTERVVMNLNITVYLREGA